VSSKVSHERGQIIKIAATIAIAHEIIWTGTKPEDEPPLGRPPYIVVLFTRGSSAASLRAPSNFSLVYGAGQKMII